LADSLANILPKGRAFYFGEDLAIDLGLMGAFLLEFGRTLGSILLPIYCVDKLLWSLLMRLVEASSAAIQKGSYRQNKSSAAQPDTSSPWHGLMSWKEAKDNVGD
jgi:hypothetical protein